MFEVFFFFLGISLIVWLLRQLKKWDDRHLILTFYVFVVLLSEWLGTQQRFP